MPQKGFDGNIAIYPETQGWGSSAFSEWYYLYADSANLGANQEFKERPDKLVYGRSNKASSRTIAAQKPGGDFVFQPRTNDCLPVLMGCFQKYIGTQLGATGTSNYTFVTEEGSPDFVGSTFGTGAFSASSGDVFTFGIAQKFKDTGGAGTNNAKMFTNCVVNQLTLTQETGEDLKMAVEVMAKTYGGTRLTVNPNNSTFGSYSTLTPLESWEGTFSVAGRTDLDVTSVQIVINNNLEDREKIGYLNPTKYEFGRPEISGVIKVDAPDEILRDHGSMLLDSAFVISGTFYNGVNDYITVSLPNNKRDTYEVNPGGANDTVEYEIPFKAYKSENGATSPITIGVRTTGVVGSFVKA